MSARGCTATLPDGRQCRATVLRDAAFCVFHDPDHADEVAEARRLGGLHRRREQTLANAYEFRGLGDAEAIRRLLEIAAYDCLGQEPSATRVRLVVAVCEAATRLLGPGDLDKRPATLEAARREVTDANGGPVHYRDEVAENDHQRELQIAALEREQALREAERAGTSSGN
jgi:hypothetical protein